MSDFHSPWDRIPKASQPFQNLAPEAPDPRDIPPVPVALNTDFYTAIAQNRKRTFLLILIMLAMLGGMGYLVGWATSLFDHSAVMQSRALSLNTPRGWMGAWIAIGIGVIWTAISIWKGDKIAIRISGARDISEAEAPQLHNIVSELSIAAGLPKPRVMIVESAAPNAFAIGYSHEKAAVGVTRGLLNMLNREEMQGVIAHELAHIANYDTRYMTMTAIIVGLVIMVGDVLRRGARMMAWRGGGMSMGGNRRGKGGGAIIAIMLVIGIIVAVLMPIMAQMLKFAVSRQREYLADATAVQITRNPRGLIGALQKLQSYVGTDRAAAKSLQHMYIVNPFKRLGSRRMNFFATHPDTNDRINRLKSLG